MRSYRFLLALVLLAAIVLPLRAGIFFGKHPKPNPAQRVPELIAVVKSDKSESKRESAARELRDYDPTTNADIVPVLVDVLQHDPAPAVRAEAAQSLGKLRPVSQVGGWALEEALKDSSIRVRLQARSSLVSYHLSGYHTDNHAAVTAPAPAPANGQSKPGFFSSTLLNRGSVAPASQSRSMTSSSETPPPPLAGSSQPSVSPRPLVPMDVPTLQKPSTDAGPDLVPEKK
jgi:hypothetical protein